MTPCVIDKVKRKSLSNGRAESSTGGARATHRNLGDDSYRIEMRSERGTKTNYRDVTHVVKQFEAARINATVSNIIQLLLDVSYI